EAKEHLGQRQGGNAAVDRAVVGVEGDLDPATKRETIDEHERRHTQLGELAERPVTELRHLKPSLAVRNLPDLGQVCARSEDEGLARDGNACDLATGCPCLLFVENLGKLDQSLGAEGVGTGMVLAIVEGDESQDLAARDRDVADE